MDLEEQFAINKKVLLNQLRETLGKMEIALGSIKDAIIWTDKAGIIQWCNTAFDQLIKRDHIEILGHNVIDLLPLEKEEKPISQEAHPVNITINSKNNTLGHYEFKQDDQKLILEISGAKSQDSKNGTCITLVIKDITEQKKAEEELKISTKKLENFNIELNKKAKIMLSLLEDLKESEERLKKTTEELKRSNEELEQFTYVASHDLQEPLRMVASFTQLLQEEYKDKLSKEANEYIYYAVDGAIRMQNLIKDLLEYSHAGKTGKPFEQVDCTIIFKQALTNLGQAIKESNAQITQDPLPTIVGDSLRLTQLFQNLIGNAIKYCDNNPPKIHIKAECKNNNEWLFSIKDNGIGIDSKHADRIFQIFQRLHGKEKYSGTGIGLALCKKIVEQHKGTIWVESELGKGSIFYFTIPAIIKS